MVLWILPCQNLFRLQDYYLLWSFFPKCSAKDFESIPQSATPKALLLRVWPLSRSLAATEKIDVSFSSSAYLDVSVQRVTSIWLWIYHTVLRYCLSGFPHSEIPESMDICSYPGLIAACHVLLRLLMPSHSPYALYSLTLVSCFLKHFELYKNLDFHKLKFPFSRGKTFPHSSLGLTYSYVFLPLYSIIICFVIV